MTVPAGTILPDPSEPAAWRDTVSAIVVLVRQLPAEGRAELIAELQRDDRDASPSEPRSAATPDEGGPWLTPKQAAHLVQRNERTVIRWIHQYEIGRRIGSRYEVSKPAVERLAAHR